MDEEYLKQAKIMAEEIAKALATRFMWIIFISVIISLILSNYISDTDSTDFSKSKRSGMEILIDAKTGIEYLSSKNGLTPRLGVGN